MSERTDSRFSIVGVLAATVCATFGGQCFADEGAKHAISAAAEAFVAKHCYDCHSSAAQEGDFDLEALTRSLGDASSVATWTTLYDRVASGEMPPETAERPSEEELAAFLAALAPQLVAADRSQREVVQRRLNRIEYENTLRDLLDIRVDLKDGIALDQQAGGFDNNGEALAISPELLQQYYETAHKALDAAIVRGERPETTTVVADSIDEVQQYVPKQFGIVDGRVVTYMRNDSQYSKISTRSQKLRVAGRYRFSFEAATHRGKEPVVFSVVASDFAGVAAKFVTLGWYEATEQPKRFDIEVDLPKGYSIQFFGHGLPHWINDVSTGDHPGVGFSPVEITGPLYDEWPPASHRRLIGDVDLEKGTLDDAETILRGFLPRAFRRAVDDEEVARYVALVAGRLDAGRTFDESLRASLATALCSPNFLYLRERAVEPGLSIDDGELAVRLSYFLWSSMPDEALSALAQEGRLHEPETLAKEVERMLDDPKSQRFVENFVGQWLQLREIDATTPDTELYPDFDEVLKVSMVRESEAFFRLLLDEDRSAVNFLDSRFATINGRLAAHYGVEGVEGLEIREVALPEESARGGLLGQGALLKVTANGTTTSPVMRGVWVLENVLGKELPPPPPNIPGLEPDIRGAETIRDQLDAHRAVASCDVCHRHIDPPGFALESFDPTGAYRDKYRKFIVNPEHADKGWGSVQAVADVDPSGKTPSGEPFADVREFKRLLVEDKQRFVQCLTEKLSTYALGRELGFSDREAIERIVAESDANGDGLRSLVHAIVQSETFRSR